MVKCNPCRGILGLSLMEAARHGVVCSQNHKHPAVSNPSGEHQSPPLATFGSVLKHVLWGLVAKCPPD